MKDQKQKSQVVRMKLWGWRWRCKVEKFGFKRCKNKVNVVMGTQSGRNALVIISRCSPTWLGRTAGKLMNKRKLLREELPSLVYMESLTCPLQLAYHSEDYVINFPMSIVSPSGFFSNPSSSTPEPAT